MEQKNIVASIYLKNGRAVKDPDHLAETQDAVALAELYNDSGVDKIMCFDLSDDEEESEKNILTIRNINRTIDVKTCGGGNIERIDDVRKFFYAGCVEVILNGAKPETQDILEEAARRFGAEKILVSIKTVDFIFKQMSLLTSCVHELIIMEPKIEQSVRSITHIPYILREDVRNVDALAETLSNDQIRGIYGPLIDDPDLGVMQLKTDLTMKGIRMDNFDPKLSWADLKKNSDGMVPVVVQDYKNLDVLMVAYMNEEAFMKTITLGKMTYWSRSRNELWTKGLTSGHIQYVKSLTADCDYDTILAKVSQVGAACHTGARSCFFNEIVKKEYVDKNPVSILEDVYNTILSRRETPVEGSYTNQLMNKGLDTILKKFGEEASEVIIASKNPDKEHVIYEEADLLYHLMVLMAEKGITWEDITRELAQR